MTWLEFIIENFKPGTSTEVAKHISRIAEDQKFKPTNKNKEAVVRHLLPKHSKGMIKITSKRKSGKELFINKDGIYFLKDSIQLNEFKLNKHKPFKRRPKKDKKLIEQEMNKYSKHDDMMQVITDYAKTHFEEYEHEYENIDFITGNKEDGVELYEIKSYDKGIYSAVGQLKYYKYYLTNIRFDNKLKVNSLNIVGNFNLEEKYKNFLIQEGINFKHINEFKK